MLIENMATLVSLPIPIGVLVEQMDSHLDEPLIIRPREPQPDGTRMIMMAHLIHCPLGNWIVQEPVAAVQQTMSSRHELAVLKHHLDDMLVAMVLSTHERIGVEDKDVDERTSNGETQK